MTAYVPIEVLRWHSVDDLLPAEDGAVLIHAPSLDPERPLVVTAWFEPGKGFSLVPVWADAVTHWMSLPEPPGECAVASERAESPRCESCGRVLRAPTGEPYRLNERHRWEYDDPVLGTVELRFGSLEQGSWVPVDSTLPEDAESVFDTFERRELIAREQAEAARNARCYLCGQLAPDSHTLCGQPVHQACYTRPAESPQGGR